MLSHHNVEGVDGAMCSSESRCCVQVTSATSEARLLNSASTEDLETECNFFDFQEIGLFPRNSTYPEVDLLFRISDPESASLHSLRCSPDLSWTGE